MTDYTIHHTPERRTIEATGDHPDYEKGEPLGTQIEGQTTFSFTPEGEDFTEDKYINLIESILDNENIEYGDDPDDPYYQVVTMENEYSYYHVAVQGDDRITLFVRTATTEESVENFHIKLEDATGLRWTVEKTETDLNGAGPNRT